jgi:2-oxoglutarate decarboxylase
MAGQGAIIGVGAMEYPAEFQGASEETLAELGISKVMTLTSAPTTTGSSRARSPASSCKIMHELLLGEDGFYDEIFTALRIPYEPVRWVKDIPATTTRSTRRPGSRADPRLPGARPPDGRHRPARVPPAQAPRPRRLEHGLTLWDLDREFHGRRLRRQAERMKLRDILGVLRDSYCRTGRHRVHAHPGPRAAQAGSRSGRAPHDQADPRGAAAHPRRLNAAEAFETFLQTKYVGQKRFSLEGGESLIPLLDAVLQRGRRVAGLDEVVIGMAHRGRLNVLANIVGKPYEQIFREFEGNLDPKSAHGSGDVKYHLGAEGKFTARTASRSRSRWPPTRPTWRPSTRCSRASSAPSRTCSTRAGTASPCCRC